MPIAAVTAMIDFDELDEWAPQLSKALENHTTISVNSTFAAVAPEYIEDARDRLLSLANRDEITDNTMAWLRSATIVGYHGTRLTDEEVNSVRAFGLLPLQASTRRDRLVRALTCHPNWREVADTLDGVIQAHGKGGRAGRREKQVHLTLSRSGLSNGFNHYLTHGAEFDQHVAHALLGAEGKDLLSRDAEPRVIQVAVPGIEALKAAHPYFSIGSLRDKGEVPNLVDEFLKAWAYWLAHPGFQSRTLRVDCGMVFCTPVPGFWITKIETLSDLRDLDHR